MQAENMKEGNPRRRDEESNRVVFCLYFRVFFIMGHFYFGISLNEEKISTTSYSGLRLAREMGEKITGLKTAHQTATALDSLKLSLSGGCFVF